MAATGGGDGDAPIYDPTCANKMGGMDAIWALQPATSRYVVSLNGTTLINL